MIINSLFFTVALPIIFILRNIEEYVWFERSATSLFRFVGHDFHNRQVFVYAVSILSLGVIATVTLNYIYETPLLHSLTVIVFFAIFINAIKYCFCSLYLRRLLPSTVSAIVLIIPFSIYMLIVSHADMFVGIKGALAYIFIAIIVMFVTVFISFWLGFFMNSYFKRYTKS